MTVTDLRDHGLVPLAEMQGMLARAAKGIPIYARDGSIRAFTMVDAADFDELARFRWYLTPQGYAARNLSHATEGRGSTLMHRQILGLDRGDSRLADHINRIRLDNRRSNLRVVQTQAEQLQNVPSRPGTSKYRGVSYYASQSDTNIAKRWRARVQQEGKTVLVGYFETEQEAADAAAAWRDAHMPFSNN